MTWVILMPLLEHISITKPWPLLAKDKARETAGASALSKIAKAAIQWTNLRCLMKCIFRNQTIFNYQLIVLVPSLNKASPVTLGLPSFTPEIKSASVKPACFKHIGHMMTKAPLEITSDSACCWSENFEGPAFTPNITALSFKKIVNGWPFVEWCFTKINCHACTMHFISREIDE